MNNYLKVLNPKRPKEQKENPFSIEERNNFDFMYMQMEENDYSFYKYASKLLMKSYAFTMAAVGFCLSKVNSMEDKFLARRVLKSFLEYAERESGYKLVWNIDDGIFKFDILDKNNSMNRVKREISTTTNLVMHKMFNSPKVKKIGPKKPKKEYDIYDRAA